MPRLQRLRRPVGLLTLSVVLLVGGACGGGNGDGLAASNPGAALSAASTRTAKDGTVKMAMTAKLGGGLSVASGAGAYDFENKRGRFELTTALGQGINIVFTTDKLYIKNPPTDTSGKTWTSATDEQLARTGANSGFLAQLRAQLNPQDSLRNLGSSVKGVHKVGKATVRGTDTIHIAGTVDLSEEAIAAAPKEAQEGMRQARAAAGTDGYPIDVYIDKVGRVWRLVYEMPVGSGASAASTTVRLDLFDFGKDAGVKIPAPSDVKEAAS